MRSMASAMPSKMRLFPLEGVPDDDDGMSIILYPQRRPARETSGGCQFDDVNDIDKNLFARHGVLVPFNEVYHY